MTTPTSLQIQAVLYKNEPHELIRALESLVNAVRYDRENSRLLGEVFFCFGDASPEPIFNNTDIDALNQRFGDLIKVNYTFFNENTGYGKGHNLMAKGCCTDYLMIENPDITVCGDYFYHMLTPFQNAKVGLTEARQTPIEHPKRYNDQTLEAEWSSGACFIMPTALFQKLDGFDTDSFFMYAEDVDLSLRIRREGKKLIYQPAAPVYHAKRVDPYAQLTHTRTEIRYSAESQLVLAYKWNKPHMLSQMLHAFENGSELQKEAAAAFRRRLNANELKRITSKTELFDDRLLENRFSL